jgi:hypothetical protein
LKNEGSICWFTVKFFLQLSRDFIDIYLLEMRKGTKNFDQEQLELVCLDLFKVRLICPAVRVCLPGSAQGQACLPGFIQVKSLSAWTCSRWELVCLDLFKEELVCLKLLKVELVHLDSRYSRYNKNLSAWTCLPGPVQGKSSSPWICSRYNLVCLDLSVFFSG